jgi:hypothetical protein
MTTATSITVRVPLAIRQRPGRKTVVTPMTDSVAPVTTRADPALVKALARAFRYQRLLDEGRYENISEMAAAEKLDRGYMGRLLQLTLLSPAIVRGLLADTFPKIPKGLLALTNPPQCWTEQSAWMREMENSHCRLAAAPFKDRS